jgi:hypothetical protein
MRVGEPTMRAKTSLERLDGGQRRHFLRHAFEMIVAMMLGMVVLGMAFRSMHLRCSAKASTMRGTSTPSSQCSR